MHHSFVISAYVLLVVIALGIIFTNNEGDEIMTVCTMDALICPDGTALSRSGPNCEFPACPEVSTKPNVPSTEETLIILESPTEGNIVTSPLTLRGKARGNWFFEASFPIAIVNWDGLIVGEGYATAEGDWMTTEFVPFTATVTYTLDPATPYARGAIILRKDNPSGLPEHDDALEVPIVFGELDV